MSAPEGREFDAEVAAPLEMIGALLDAREVEWGGSDEELVATLAGGWSRYELRCLWQADDEVLQILAWPELRVGADRLAKVHETLALINEQMWLGHFDHWSNGGVLLYRHATLVERGGVLTLDRAALLVDTAVDEWERFYPVFQFVLWSDKSPREAIEAAMIETHGEA